MKPSVLILIVVLLVVFLYCGKETAERLIGSGTRIFRTTGVYNEANEIQLPPGIVTGTPVFDYTHTYWDGVSDRSCDECPNPAICPKCPKYTENFSIVGSTDGVSNVGSTDGVSNVGNVSEEADIANYDIYMVNHEPISAAFTVEKYDMHGIRPLNVDWDPVLKRLDSKQCGGCALNEFHSDINNEKALDLFYEHPDTHGVSNKPSVDFSSGLPGYLDPDQVDSVMVNEGDDPEFWQGRGKLGACSSRSVGRNPNRYVGNVAYLGTKNDDYFDGERAVILGVLKRPCNYPTSSVKLFNQNRLDKIAIKEHPQREPREFIGEQGYIYKEQGMA